MSLGEKVRGLRERLGIKQKDLADRTGITQATISRIESGEIEELKAGTLSRLAEALDASVDYLVGRTETSDPKVIAAHGPGAQELLQAFAELTVKEKDQVIKFAAFLGKQKKGKHAVLSYLAGRGKRRPRLRLRLRTPR